jgi:uncharacterized protein YrzB (UPF0473 family)
MTETERDEVVVLTDDEGNEFEFQIIDVLEVEGNRYAVLFPLDDEDADDDEALIMRLETDEDGDDVLVDIEDDQEWEKVVAEWESMLDDEEDLEEELELDDESDK